MGILWTVPDQVAQVPDVHDWNAPDEGIVEIDSRDMFFGTMFASKKATVLALISNLLDVEFHG